MSKLTLVPPDASTQPPSFETMTEDQAREYLSNVHSPGLDEVRARLGALKTSELLAWAGNPGLFADTIRTDATTEHEMHMLMLAVMLAVSDEIDRRIPIPTP